MDTAPYKCHVFVCVNDRKGAKKSCADGDSPALRLALKEQLRERGIAPGDVRVSQSLCMGLCDSGPNVVIYPQNVRISAAGIADIERIVAIIETLLESSR